MCSKYTNHISEINRAHNGLLVTIMAWRNANDIDIMFENNVPVFHKTYSAFKSGHIFLPTMKNEPTNDWINKSSCDRNGNRAKIIEVSKDNIITVRYTNGEIMSGLTLDEFLAGNFGPEYEESSEEYVLRERNRAKQTIAEERQKTYDNVLYQLLKYRKCVMIRPCGFGKTWIGMKLFKHKRFKKCLFLHPLKDELNALKVGDLATCKTYAWLSSRTDEQINKMNYDLVFFDECHLLGGDEDGRGATETFKAVKKLMAWHPETHFLGATATPMRMDGINVVKELFMNHTCYPYTEEDAVDDGILKIPYYTHTMYNVEKKVRDAIKNEHVTVDREAIAKIMKSDALNEIDARYMPKHLKEHCKKAGIDTNYMRFIVFYLHIDGEDGISDNKEKVERWFKTAFPEHKIYSTVVHSRSKEDLDTVDALPVEDKRIDLIFNCEKLCMGYHSELVTGLIMERKTQSFIKYQQMMGRMFSCDNDKPVIIFDIADNIHTKFICKAEPQQAPKITIEKPESLKKQPMTFDEVIAINPDAINWEVIERHNVKAIQKDLLEGYTSEGVAESDWYGVFEIRSPYENEESPINNLPAALQDAHKRTVAEKTDFQTAMEIYSNVLKENGRSPEKGFTAEDFGLVPIAPVPQSQNTDNSPTESSQSSQSRAKTPANDTTSVGPMRVDNIVDNNDYEGYNPDHYIYNPNDRSLLRAQAEIAVLKANEVIDKLIRNPVREKIRQIIAKWHTYPGCENDYHAYTEVDASSHPYKMLRGCAEIYSCRIEPVLHYMIEETNQQPTT